MVYPASQVILEALAKGPMPQFFSSRDVPRLSNFVPKTVPKITQPYDIQEIQR